MRGTAGSAPRGSWPTPSAQLKHLDGELKSCLWEWGSILSIYCQYSSIIFCYAPQAHALTLTHADSISRTSPKVRLLGSSQRASCVSSSASCACPSPNRCLALNDHHKAPRFSSLPIKASKVQAKKHQKALGLRNDSEYTYKFRKYKPPPPPPPRVLHQKLAHHKTFATEHLCTASLSESFYTRNAF